MAKRKYHSYKFKENSLELAIKELVNITVKQSTLRKKKIALEQQLEETKKELEMQISRYLEQKKRILYLFEADNVKSIKVDNVEYSVENNELKRKLILD